MELTKKTTILFPPDLFDQLSDLAKRQHRSVGELVRDACRRCYGLASPQDRLAAVDRLRALALPVGTPQAMKRESVPDADDLLP